MTVEARKAAAGILVSGGEDRYVLMARRNRNLKFAPGQHVFPGGRVDAEEGSAHVIHAANEDEAAFIHAAAREIFEETGLLCVVGELPSREATRAFRLAGHSTATAFDAFLARFSLTIDAREFIPAGMWITPLDAPIRFETCYYLYQVTGERNEELIEGEITALEWMRPADARARWRAGELRLSPPVACVLQHLAELPLADAVSVLRQGLDRSPGVPSRAEVRCGIHILPLETPTLPPARHTNCVVVGEKELIVIDPGPTDDEEQEHLLGQIRRFEELGARVRAIALTHSHIDHVGAAPFLRERLEVPIWCHEAAAAQLIFPVDGLLSDGQVIDIAGTPSWRLRCIHTPGHDPGHLCFLEESTRTLIAGDMVAHPGTIVISLDVGGNMTAYLNSLEQLHTLDFSILIPSHGMPPSHPKEKIRRMIEHRLNREEKLKAMLAKGLSHMDELVAAVYDDVHPDVWPLAKHSLHAHLHRLGHAGTEPVK